jgi:folate-dependent phosphoribosylglycinamide formyltransferase PurN
MNNRPVKIGLTVHNFEHPQTLTILKHFVQQEIKLDFIIFHQNPYKRKIIEFKNFILKRNSNLKSELLEEIKNIDIHNISNINSKEAANVFKKYAPSLIFCNTGIITKKTINDHPDTFLLNVHGSQLPKYRGVSNLHWALWDKADIYVTVHRINNGIDEGDILYQEMALKNAGDLISSGKVDELINLLPLITCKAIKKFNNNEIQFISQDYLGEPMMQYYSMHPILQKIVNARN